MTRDPPMQVYVHNDFFLDRKGRTLLRRLVGERVELVFEKEAGEEELAVVREHAEVLMGYQLGRELLDSMPHLKAILIPFSGVHPNDQKLLTGRKGITVINSHYNDRVVAEHAFTLLLAVSKRILAYDGFIRRGDWSQRFTTSDSLDMGHSSLGIIGYGSIGRWVHTFARPFGMKVGAIRRDPSKFSPDDGLDWTGGWEDRFELLGVSDLVLISLPLTPDTEDVFGREELAAMKSTAYLVNVSRGRIVNEMALYETLRDHRIAGAGLEVWYRYPRSPEEWEHTMPADHPFWELDNVLMSPHRASSVTTADELLARDLARTLLSLAGGEESRNVVLPEKGY